MGNRAIIWQATRSAARTLVALMFVFSTAQAYAINIEIDYSYDTYGFYSISTTNGQNARATVEAAADYFSEILADTFSAISVPAPYYSQTFNGWRDWSWDISFFNPSASGNVTITNPTFSENEFVIYVGANYYSGNTLGQGGPGGRGYSITGGGSFTSAEINEINNIDDNFIKSVNTRGETSGFVNWGGAISLDIDSNWNYDHTVSPSSGQNDLYSVVLHEMAHVIGLGGTDEWNAFVSGGYFTGTNAQNEYGGIVPLDSNTAHFAENTMSRVFGGTDNQEALMDPDITVGTRKFLTALEAAALSDIGWTVVEPTIPTLAGDYNDDGVVDAADFTVYRDNWNSTTELEADGSGNGVIDLADYTVWVNAYGDSSSNTSSAASIPEPTALLLSTLALSLLVSCRSQR